MSGGGSAGSGNNAVVLSSELGKRKNRWGEDDGPGPAPGRK
jgi:hypothetical protein